MRLLHSFNDDRYAKAFSSYLTEEGIENKLEIQKNTDWGSDDYGTVTASLWIIDEDAVDAARKWLDVYLENPNDERFKHHRPPSQSQILETTRPAVHEKKAHIQKAPPPPPPLPPKQQPLGFATFYLILTCTLIFFVSLMTSRTPEPYPKIIPPTPLFLSNIVKELYYDYPNAFEIIDKLVAAYGFDKVIHPQLLPPEGKTLLDQFTHTPYWKGVYGKLVNYMKNPREPIKWNEPMFEKIKQGEVWRLFTPCLLHAGILHIFFNMVWLFVLGQQMENKLGVPRYLIFILLTGILSNTAQYLISGSNFMGISGVLCAMIVFVWVRQKKTPWEGYQLTPGTLKFITLFIGILAVAGVVSFFLESTGLEAFSLPIANTAHLSGAFAGLILAQSNFFSRRTKKKKL